MSQPRSPTGANYPMPIGRPESSPRAVKQKPQDQTPGLQVLISGRSTDDRSGESREVLIPNSQVASPQTGFRRPRLRRSNQHTTSSIYIGHTRCTPCFEEALVDLNQLQFGRYAGPVACLKCCSQ
jgi:hypothetical protein